MLLESARDPESIQNDLRQLPQPPSARGIYRVICNALQRDDLVVVQLQGEERKGTKLANIRSGIYAECREAGFSASVTHKQDTLVVTKKPDPNAAVKADATSPPQDVVASNISAAQTVQKRPQVGGIVMPAEGQVAAPAKQEDVERHHYPTSLTKKRPAAALSYLRQ